MNTSNRYDVTRLKQCAKGRELDALVELGGADSKRLDGKNHSCQICGGTDRFRLLDKETGALFCNQCFNKNNGDFIAGLMWLKGWTFPEALKRLAEWLGVSESGGQSNATSKRKPATKEKAGSKTRKYDTFEGAAKRAQMLVLKAEKIDPGEPASIYQYGPDSDGRTEWELRFEFEKDGERHKTSRPISQRDGKFVVKVLTEQRPLFNCEQLHQNPTADAVVLEGPKAAQKAIDIGYLATTSPGGSSNAKKADWTTLSGRNVAVIPDCDAPGEKYGRQVAEALSKLPTPAASVKIVELPGLKEGEDLVEWCENGGTREQLDKLIADAPEWVPAAKDAMQLDDDDKVIRNYLIAKDAEGEPIKVPMKMKSCLEIMRTITGDWPRTVGGLLFVVIGMRVYYLEKLAAFLGWLQSECGVEWQKNGSEYVTQSEFYEEAKRTATAYHAVEELPHEPKIPGHFYACKDLKPGDGSYLKKLVGFFCPLTSVDRELITALFVIALWGGDPGLRPMFMITAGGGRGRGKSKLAHAVAELFGGAIEISTGEKMEGVKTRLLAPGALSKRLCILDNVKSQKLSWGDLEAIVTAATISGHRMYMGEASRPNLLTWVLTINGASLSTDLAQRVVEIRLADPVYDPGWQEKVFGFIRENREAILADIAGFLRQPAQAVESPSRWATFDREIIGRLSDPDAIMEVIHSRRAECDSEGEEADVIRDEFASRLRGLGYDLEREDIFISSQTATRWFNSATGEHFKTSGVTRTLKQLRDEGRFHEILPARTSQGRGFRWVGEKCLDGSPTKYDLLSRLSEIRHNDEDQTARQGYF